MRAARWVALTRLVVEVGTLASSVLLAHLLSPAEIGRAVVALVAIPLSTILLNGTVAPALIQRGELGREDLETGHALSLAGGVVFTVLCLAAAPLFTSLMDKQTGEALALAAPVFLITGVGVVPDAILRRRLDFRRLGMVEIAAALLGTAISVALAL